MKTFKIFKMALLAFLFAIVASAFFSDEPAKLVLTTSVATVLAIGSVKTSADMKVERHAVYERAQGILDKAKAEKRSLTDAEKTEYDALDRQLDEMEADIKRQEKAERRALEMAGGVIDQRSKDKEDKELKSYSFLRAIRMAAEGRSLDGIEGEMQKEAEKEARNNGTSINGVGIPSIILFGKERRAATATGTTSTAGDQGGFLVPTEKVGFIEALLNKMVVKGLGIQTLTGLVGNVDIPKKSTTLAAAWEAENGDADETNYLFGKLSLTPRRLAAFTKVSRQLMIQSSYDVEMMVRNDLQLAIALAVEQAIINGAGSGSNQPTGILATSGIGSVAIGTTGGAPTLAHIVNLEREVAVDNADLGALAYLTNTKVRAKLKLTQTDANNGFPVWGAEPTPLNGYRAAVTNLVPSNLEKSTSGTVCSAIIFGNFNDYVIGQWGGIDIVVDPYSLSKAGQVQLVVNSFWDGGCRNAESFAAVLDATT